MMHINHIDLSTGHTARTSRADVMVDTIAALRQWLDSTMYPAFWEIFKINNRLRIPTKG